MSHANIIDKMLGGTDKLDKKALVAHCTYLQEATIRLGNQLSEASKKLREMCVCAHDLGAQLYALVDAFDANDQEAIAVQLKQMSDRRKSFKKPEVH